MSRTSPSPSAPLGLRTKLGYGLGNFACMTGKQAPKQLALPIYNVALGVNPGAVGAILALGRVWDAVTDPLVGHWSDRVSTRWGRRRPFIFAGALLTALFFVVLWMFPRGWSPGSYLAYFAVSSFLFYLALTFFAVPWYALGYELAPDYDERTRLMAYPAAIGPVAQIAVAWLYAFTQLDCFADTIEGVRAMGLLAGLALLVFGLMPVFFVREPACPPPRAASRPRPPSLLDGVKAAARNRPFRQLTITFTSIIIGSSIVGGLGFYVMTYYLYGGDTKAAAVLGGWKGTITNISTIVFTPVASRLALRFGKKEIFRAAVLWGIGRMALLWFLLVPAYPWLLLVNAVLQGIEGAVIFMLCHAMIADVCDLDELEHGTRREGLFGALYAWLFKTGIALAYGASGYVLLLIGFDRGQGGAQPEGTLLAMKIAFCLIPAVAFLVALRALSGYELDRRRAGEIRAALAERRASESVSSS